MDIKLIAIDLDGTLLTSSKVISQKTVDVIGEARSCRAVEVVIATARPPRTTLPFYHTLELDGPMINYNGALVWEPSTHKIISHQPIAVNIARGIIKWARERYPAIRVSAEIDDKWHTDFFDGTYQTETSVLYQPDVLGPIDDWLTQPITKLLLLGKEEWLTAINDAIAKDLPGEVSTIHADSFLLQITHSTASKSSAVQTIAQQLSIPREKVMAIGDNLNDIDMIAWAGVGVAMSNGHILSLSVADHVTTHNDEDGVAEAINQIVIEGQPPKGF